MRGGFGSVERGGVGGGSGVPGGVGVGGFGGVGSGSFGLGGVGVVCIRIPASFYSSLKSPLCSCVSSTLPASSKRESQTGASQSELLRDGWRQPRSDSRKCARMAVPLK